VLLGAICCSYLPAYVRNLQSLAFSSSPCSWFCRQITWLDWFNDAFPESCAGRDRAAASRKQGAAEFVHVLKHALTEYHKVHPEISKDQFAVVDELTTGSLPIVGKGRRDVFAPDVVRVHAAPAMEMER
jgi:hypothetical protein